MKLSLNAESVDALREFAKKLPMVVDEIIERTESLFSTYNSVAEYAGPHKQEFIDMLQSVKRAQEIAVESFEELPYMLNSTADKMESYIKHGLSSGALLAENPDITKRYAEFAQARLDSEGTNPITKEIYEEYKSNVRIVDYDFKGTPFYNSLLKGIKLNAMADLHNPTGYMSTYFHEVGHMIDDYAGNGHAWLSSDPDFIKYLRQDVDAYINKTVIILHCDLTEAYDLISEEICGNWSANVSDIFGSLTGCRCQGDWGHHITYWEADSSRVEKEAFANMFEASIGDSKKLETMKAFFPNAYARFEYIVRSR